MDAISLDIPVNFVSRRFSEFGIDDPTLPDIDSPEFPVRLIKGGRNAWTVQTFLRLRGRCAGIHASSDFREGYINVAHYDQIRPDRRLADYFIVSVRADRDPTFICQLELCQNPQAIRRSYQHFMPSWPQQGLRPRAQERAAMLQRVAYMGELRNLAPAFRSEDFRKRLADLGIEFVIELNNWSDYSSIDAIIAVRNACDRFLDGKPAAKLVNAWFAGCPALLGKESAYRAAGIPGVNYIEIGGVEEAIHALWHLKNDANSYRRIIENGRDALRDYTVDSVAQRWVRFLAGPAASAYKDWNTGLNSWHAARVSIYHYKMIRRRLWGHQYYEGYDDLGRLMPETFLGRVRRSLFGP